MSRLLSSLFLGCAMLCCAVLSCTVLCCKVPEDNAPVARGREDHLPGYHQGPGSPRPQSWSALPPLLEGEDQLHHAGALYLRKAKEMGAAGQGPCVGWDLGPPRTEHSTAQHSTSDHITAQHRTQHSTTGEKGSFCGYGGAGAGAGAGAGGGGGGGLRFCHPPFLDPPPPYHSLAPPEATKQQSEKATKQKKM